MLKLISQKCNIVINKKSSTEKVSENLICACMCTLQLHKQKIINDIRRPQMNENQRYKIMANKKYN